MGAFEALWANGISSFKQLRDKLTTTKTDHLSTLVDSNTAKQFYEKTVQIFNSANISDFGLRIDGTIDYPEKLHDAECPLAFLYFRGNWDLIYTRGLAVVGTRKPTIEGIKGAKRLTKELVKAGFTIYSGLAVGIDTVAHTTALEEGGKTVAVIGPPFHHIP